MSLDFHYGWSDAGKVPIKIIELSNHNCVQQLEFLEIYLFHKKTVTKNAAKY